MPDKIKVTYSSGVIKEVTATTAAKIYRRQARQAIERAMAHDIEYYELFNILKHPVNDYRCLISECLTGKKGSYSFSTCEECFFESKYGCVLKLITSELMTEDTASSYIKKLLDLKGIGTLELFIIKVHAGLQATGLGNKSQKR